MSKMIQVRNVPDRLHRELVKRAKKAGLALTYYIQPLLEREVSRPPSAEVFDRIAQRPKANLGRPAADAVIDLVDLALTRHGHLTLLGRILRLRDNFSAHDAVYVALAEQLGAEFVTADGGLVRAVRGYLNISVIDASGA